MKKQNKNNQPVPIFYLANPYNLKEQTRKWEKYIESNYHIDLLNPFYDERNPIEQTIANIKQSLKPHTLDFCNNIVKEDLKRIDESSGIISILNEPPTIGTLMEMFYGYQLNKPVYSILQYSESKIQHHPWIRTVSTQIFKTKKCFENWLKGGELLNGR